MIRPSIPFMTLLFAALVVLQIPTYDERHQQEDQEAAEIAMICGPNGTSDTETMQEPDNE